ncbi:mRNA (guanine-N(7))-methyltransferase domain [Dillenia turbinata]|uniref:mRNA (guanine-N(7))-methyltransferase n=1 Tax=Dillenia turbinata TaxID=194707 RepID=A0AAN8VQT5_9MAGN
MKRGYSDSDSTSLRPPHSRFRPNPEGVAHFIEDHSTKTFARKLYAHRGDAFVDLACGKIEDCRTHYNGVGDQNQRRKKFTFPARLIWGDCYEVLLDNVLEDDVPFDIISCQFAMHYSWSTEA